jgi:hypothetical protein
MHKRITAGNALFVGLIAVGAVGLSVQVGVPVWAVFFGWVLYFVFATGTRVAILGCLQIIVGLGIGAAVVHFNGQMSPTLGVLSLMVLAFAIAFIFVFVESLAPFNNIPAYYLGAIAMMASGMSPALESIGTMALSVVLGFILGWITVCGRARVSGLLAEKRIG